MALGEGLRDWAVDEMPLALFPYDSACRPLDLNAYPVEQSYLGQYRDILANTYLFGGQTKVEGGLEWFEYGRLTASKYSTPKFIALPEISTHNHFVFSDRPHRLFKHSAQVIKLDKGKGVGDHAVVTALMNSNTACFCLKQLCFDRRAGKDPIRDTYYVFAGTAVGKTPMPAILEEGTHDSHQMLILSEEMLGLADLLPSLATRKILEQMGEAYRAWNSSLDGYVAPHPDLPSPFISARELREARDELIALRQDIRGRMMFVQEEMDWLAYGMYGLIKKAPLAEDYLSPSEFRAARLALGIRPFEMAGKGYEGDWPEGFQPTPLPDTLRSLTEARMAIIESNPDIALLEDPLYKRRWVPPDYDKKFREAVGWWLAEKLEWALEQHGQPISLRRWARSLGQDERVNAVLDVLTGTPMFDLERELLKVIQANAVPNRPEHYLKPAGLRKFYGPEPTPQYKRGEFSDGTAWKIRGKLNIPRERFIAYAEFDHTRRGMDTPENGGPWFGWAGWDTGQRADALAFLLDQANRAGWRLHWQQCGLRAALRDLLPELADLPAADRAEFAAIGTMCGISLESRCYCQAYREAVARGEPGVPGVTEEVLAVKVLPAGEGRQRRARKRKDKGEQMGLGLGE